MIKKYFILTVIFVLTLPIFSQENDAIQIEDLRVELMDETADHLLVVFSLSTWEPVAKVVIKSTNKNTGNLIREDVIEITPVNGQYTFSWDKLAMEINNNRLVLPYFIGQAGMENISLEITIRGKQDETLDSGFFNK